MPDGGALTITGREESTGVVLSVTDTGIAIRPEDLPKIFQPLFTTKAKGIGLGLAVAKDLAVANRAVITVESAGSGKPIRRVVRAAGRAISRGSHHGARR
jgi:signal transduction histidine kinase